MAIKLKQNEQILIGIFAVLAPIIIGWFMILEPQYNGIQKVIKKKNEKERNLTINQTELVMAKQRQERIKAQDFTKKTMPDLLEQSEEAAITTEVNKTLNIISETNNSIIEVRPLGYQNGSFSDTSASSNTGDPPPPSLSQFILEVPCLYTIRGTFNSINNLIKTIVESDEIIEIFELQIAPDISKGGAINYTDPSKPLKARVGIIYPIKTKNWSEKSADSFKKND